MDVTVTTDILDGSPVVIDKITLMDSVYRPVNENPSLVHVAYRLHGVSTSETASLLVYPGAIESIGDRIAERLYERYVRPLRDDEIVSMKQGAIKSIGKYWEDSAVGWQDVLGLIATIEHLVGKTYDNYG